MKCSKCWLFDNPSKCMNNEYRTKTWSEFKIGSHDRPCRQMLSIIKLAKRSTSIYRKCPSASSQLCGESNGEPSEDLCIECVAREATK